MIELIYTNHFLKASKKLPSFIQNQLATKLEILSETPFRAPLHTKLLTGQLSGFYSFRITREWRVVFCFQNSKTIKLIDVAHRKDIYK